MKNLIILIVVGFSFASGAYFHERDIVNSCKENGKAGQASWTGEIICNEMKVSNGY